jgi:hypothetical protein
MKNESWKHYGGQNYLSEEVTSKKRKQVTESKKETH